MAEKSFGIKELNLIGASGTPTIESPNDIVFKSGGSNERLRIPSGGDLFVAGTGGMNTTQLPNGSTINVNGTSSNDGLSVIRYSTGYGAYGLNIGRSKSGTLGTNAAVTDGNDLGHISFYGADGTDFNMAAQITSQVDGTPSDGTDMPGRLVFKTSSDGSATPTERLRIDSSGFIKQQFTSNNSTTAEGLFINNLNNGTGNNASLILSNDSGERKKAAIALIDTGSYGAGDLVFALDGADSGELHLTNDEKLRIASNGTTTVGPQYDRVAIEPGNGTYDGEATTLTVDGRTNDGNRVALKVDRYDSGTSATTKFSVKYDGSIFSTSGMQASSVNLQNSGTSSWFQTGTSIASYDYVWAAKNSSSNIWHSGLQTDGDLYLGGNLAGTNNIALNGSSGSAWFSGSVAIGGNASANTIDEYEEGTFDPTISPQSGGTITLNSGYNTLSYTRIGRLVLISGQIRVSSVNSPVGNTNITNLPFTVQSTTEQGRAGANCFYYDASAGSGNYYKAVPIHVTEGTTILKILNLHALGGFNPAANDELTFAISYITT